MTIQAQHSGICPECGERWQPGDSLRGADNELPYEQRRRPTIWRHVACPETADDTGALHEVGQPLGDTVYDNERRADARAALEVAAPLIAAQALQEAADDIERRINEPGLILMADKYGGYHAGERHRAQREVDILRARADEVAGAKSGHWSDPTPAGEVYYCLCHESGPGTET